VLARCPLAAWPMPHCPVILGCSILQVVSAGMKAGVLHTALEVAYKDVSGAEATALICSSRGRAVPLALSALEYLAARVNTELEARGATIAVENDIAVTPSGVPSAPSADLLAAAERSAPAATDLGMLLPIARPWRTVPTIPLAGIPAMTLTRTAAGKQTLTGTVPVRNTVLFTMMCCCALVALAFTCAEVTSELDSCDKGFPSAASGCTTGTLLRHAIVADDAWMRWLYAMYALLAALFLWPYRWEFTLTADGSWTLRTRVVWWLPFYLIATGKDLLGAKVRALR
jgi:hypothetical protein